MIERRFNKNSTAEEVTVGTDLSGKTIVITGINSGLGRESMRVLEMRGAHIIGTARTLEKATAAAKENGGNITPLACELSDFSSVKACSDAIAKMSTPIDVLLCNAGIMALPELELGNGFEQQFNTNHLGHFILIHNLLDRVKQAKQGRIVLLSSMAHAMAPSGGIDFDNLDGSKGYNDWAFYGQSKLANLLTAVALTKHLKGSSVTANAVHPGVIRTNLGRNIGGIQGFLFKNPITGPLVLMFMKGKNVPKGAATQCYAATATELAKISGKYFADNAEETPSEYGADDVLAERLWAFSVKAVAQYLK